MKKILYGILAIFMSFAVAYGGSFVVDNIVETSTQTEDVETASATTKRWIDIVNDGSGNYFSRYGGTVEVKDGKTIATIGAELAGVNYDNPGHKAHGLNKASLALAGWNLCTRIWDEWRGYTLNIECDINMSGYRWTPVGTGDLDMKLDTSSIGAIFDNVANAKWESKPFTGTFNGNGYKISGIYIYESKDTYVNDYGLEWGGYSNLGFTIDPFFARIGFFGIVKDAKIHDFSINGHVYVDCDGFSGYSSALIDYNYDFNADIGVIGYATGDSSIENIICEDFNIYHYCFSDDYYLFQTGLYIGGIVGRMDDESKISNCINRNGFISLTNKSTKDSISECFVGGIVGKYSSNKFVEYCANYSDIRIWNSTLEKKKSSYGTLSVAGIIGGVGGDSQRFNISNCYSSGDIYSHDYISASYSLFGGIVGFLFSHDIGKNLNNYVWIYGCHNYSNIYVDQMYNTAIGGIAPRNGAEIYISNCSNFGNIQAWAEQKDNDGLGFGGILGESDKHWTSIDNCVNYGDILIRGEKAIKYVGGIVGHVWNNALIAANMNYGTVRGKECVGGIAGELGRWKSTFKGAYTNFALANCINYSPYIRGEKYVGQIVGSIWNQGRIKSCMYLSGININMVGYYDSGKLEFCKAISSSSLFTEYTYGISDKTTWFKGELGDDGKITVGSDDTFSKWTSDSSVSIPSSNDYWVLTSAAYNYLGNTAFKDKTGYNFGKNGYSFVPASALMKFTISAEWRKSGSSSYDSIWINDTFNRDVGKIWTSISKISYSKEYKVESCSSKTVLYTDTYRIVCLAGAEYSDNSSVFQFEGTGNFELEEAYFLNSFSSLVDKTEVSLSSGVIGSFQINPMMELREEYTQTSYPTLYLKFKSNTKNFSDIKEEKKVSYKYRTRTLYADGESCGDVSFYKKTSLPLGTFWDPLGVKSKIDYQDEIKITITPTIGFRVESVVIKVGSETTKTLSNSELGRFSVTFNYSYEDTVLIYFTRVDYIVRFYSDEKNDGNLLCAYAGVRVALPGRIVVSEIASQCMLNKSKSSFMSFGYTYTFKVDGKEDPFLENIHPSGEGREIEFSATKFIGTENNQFSDINSNEIDIIVTRTALEISLNVFTYADKYNSDTFSKSSNGGTVSAPETISLKDNSSFTVRYEKNNGYNLSNILFSNTQDEDIGADDNYLSVSPVYRRPIIDRKKTSKTYKIQTLIDSYIAKYCDYKQSEWQSYEINVLVLFELKTYTFKFSTEDCPSGMSYKITIENGKGTNGGNTILTCGAHDITSVTVKYFTPITITSDTGDYYKYRYLGLYNDTELLTTGTKYSFFVNPNDNSLSTLTISPKYQEFATTTQAGFDAYYKTIENPDATAKNVYKIQSAEDLVLLSQKVNAGERFADYKFVQTANIDMSGIDFNPIGNGDNPFMGVYDGGNYTISNLKIVGGNKISYVGLFGYTEYATIKNLTIKDSSFAGYSYAGVLVGKAVKTTFERVNSYNCDFDSKSVDVYDIYGGTVKKGQKCTYYLAADDVPELSEQDHSEISNDIAGRQSVGGLVGYAGGCSFFASSVRSKIRTGDVVSWIGGLVGYATNSKIDQCFVIGSVSGNGYITRGGNNSITNCFWRINNFYLSICYDEDGKEVLEKNFVDKDDDIWIVVNDCIHLKVFYWY